MDRKSTQSSINNHKTIGYAIGLLGLFVSCIVIYGVGGPLFPNRRLSKEDKEKGYYENFVPIIAKFHFLAFLCWLYAVYTNKLVAIRISFVFWSGNILLAILCACFYFFEGITRQFKEREIYLMSGVAYWICSLIVASIWYMTKKEECARIAETELFPIK